MTNGIVHQPVNFDQTAVAKSDNFPEEITIKYLINDAPESEWREMCAIIDANPAFIAKCRAARQAQGDQAKPRRQRRQRSRPSTSTRHFSAASVLHSQAGQVGKAIVETLERVNSGELDGDGETRSILVTTATGDATIVMEVVA